MTDLVDKANADNELIVAVQTRNIQRMHERQAHQASAEFCELCACSIPDERRHAVPGVRLCVVCQSQQERLYR